MIKIEKKNGKYNVNLPWKLNHDVLCDNYEIARRRLDFTLKRLRRDPELSEEYAKIMKVQEEDRVIEEVKRSNHSLYATPSCGEKR